MKQIKNLAWMSAIALAGTITFAACSSDDDKVQNINPTYDGKSVKTQFAINIPRAAQTRQTAEITQNNSNFRGMQDIKLIPMRAGVIEGSTTENFSKIISLDNIGDEVTSDKSNKIYSDVEIPVETKSFLFYGEAIKDGDNNSHNGVLTPSGLTEGSSVSNINFTLKNVLENSESFNSARSSLISYLNTIINVTNWDTTDNEDLKEAYTKLTKLNVCASSYILQMVQEVYNIANELKGDGTYGTLATNICTAIIGGNPAPFKAAADGTLSFETNDNNIIQFPTTFGFPFGAVPIVFDNESFKAADSYIGTTTNHVKVSSICYPASLYYFTNTGLRANNQTVDAATWPTTTAGWANYEWNGWGDIVTAGTHSIALKENIQYGVALLETNVQTNSISLEDNAMAVANQPVNQKITVSDNSFQLTGVLVGAQPSKLGWNMKATNDATYDYTIYDSEMNGNIYATTTNASKNYTMVLDNTSAADKPVHIAIELVNNSGQPFYGVDGIVPMNAKFYMVAKLDPTSGTGNFVQPTPNVSNHVFIQDHTTIANLKINSLKNAYVNIPDLRSTKLQLGLSVDLEWKDGLKFSATIE